jgi:ABC-2 type transport system ATP-binding protein
VLVPTSELPGLREGHLVSRVTRTPAGVRARVLSEAPPLPDAVPARPDLEDAYLRAVHSAAAPVSPVQRMAS